MDTLQIARELGKAIQNDDRYLVLQLARQANDNDERLQALMEGFQRKRTELSVEMSKEEMDIPHVEELDSLCNSLYNQIMNSPGMLAYARAKQDFEQLIEEINSVISQCAEGADPDSCVPQIAGGGCSGNCGGCAGCG